jgi:TldD protein
VLAQLQPGPARIAESCRATGGCGKLGQFPLLVSFANAGFVLPAGSVRIEVDDG